MTAPMPQMAPMQPPTPPPTPFPPRANDNEPAVALATAKRLSKLMFDPRFSEKPPEWQDVVNQRYQAAIQALAPAPVLPKGVIIKADATSPEQLAADEQAAATGKPPAPRQQVMQSHQVQPGTQQQARPIPQMPHVGP